MPGRQGLAFCDDRNLLGVDINPILIGVAFAISRFSYKESRSISYFFM